MLDVDRAIGQDSETISVDYCSEWWSCCEVIAADRFRNCPIAGLMQSVFVPLLINQSSFISDRKRP